MKYSKLPIIILTSVLNAAYKNFYENVHDFIFFIAIQEINLKLVREVRWPQNNIMIFQGISP